jgi:hypothetical protein
MGFSLKISATIIGTSVILLPLYLNKYLLVIVFYTTLCHISMVYQITNDKIA